MLSFSVLRNCMVRKGGSNQGYVTDLMLDASGVRVIGVVCYTGALGRRRFYFLTQLTQYDGFLLTDGSPVRYPVGQLKPFSSYVGKECFNNHVLLGRLKDALFDAVGDIVGLELECGFLDGLRRGRKIVSEFDSIQQGKDCLRIMGDISISHALANKYKALFE